MTDYRNDRVGGWYKARLFSVRSAVLANKKRIQELNAAIRTEGEALAELKVEMEFEAQEQRRLRAPFWRDGSRLAFQARKAAEAGSLAVVHVGSGLPPRRAFSGVQREAPFPRPRPVVMPENNLPLHALAREEPHRHREFAPRQLAVARIDELYSRPPPVQYEQDPQEISAIIHRDPRMQIMPSWQPVQVVPEDLDVEMTDAPALLEFNMSGALGDACSAAHGSMELFQPAQVVGLVSTYTLSLLFAVDNLLTPYLQQHTNFPVTHACLQHGTCTTFTSAASTRRRSRQQLDRHLGGLGVCRDSRWCSSGHDHEQANNIYTHQWRSPRPGEIGSSRGPCFGSGPSHRQQARSRPSSTCTSVYCPGSPQDNWRSGPATATAVGHQQLDFGSRREHFFLVRHPGGPTPP